MSITRGSLVAKPKVTKTTVADKNKTKLSAFGEALKAARKAGKGTFEFTKDGKTSIYTTKLASDKPTTQKKTVNRATPKRPSTSSKRNTHFKVVTSADD